MADNIAAKSDASTTIGTFAADEIASVLYVRNKITLGADGVNDGDLCDTLPMPVKGTGTAGTAHAGVVTVQGIASMTPVQIADNGGSITVDGTVDVSGTVTVDGSGVTQPISVDSLPLPTGAATAAKQPALGTAGTPSTDVISIQGVASGTVVPVSDGGGALTVDGTVAVTDGSGSLTVDAPVGTPVFVRLSDGASAISTLPVSLASVPSHAVTNAGTFAVQADGSVAHDSADSGNPLKLGAKASTALSGLTLVANADRTDLYAAVDGALITRGVCLEDVVQERTTNTDGASTAFASGLAAPGSGIRLWITNVDIANSSASFCTVDLRDGSAGSVLWTLPVPASGGVVKRFDPPLKLTANTALAFDASAATSTLSISANGFKSKI